MRKFIPRSNTYIFRCEDEIVPGQPELDYLLINPDIQVYLSIGSFEAKVWKLLQAQKNSSDIVAVLSLETGMFEQDRVEALLDEWHQLKLIRYHGEHTSHHHRPLWQRLVWTEISITKVGKWLSRFYDVCGKHLTSRLGAAAMIGLVTAGFVSAAYQAWTQQIVLLSAPSLPTILLLFVMGLVSLSLHELGHAIAMCWAQAKVLRVGVALYLGLPVFFVDTTTVWAKRRYKRVVTAAAGIMSNLVQAAAAALLAMLVTDMFTKALMWEWVIINLTMIAISVIPFIRMDGYYIMVDLVGVPKIDKKAFHELKEWAVHPRRYNYSRDHILLLGYGTLAIAFSGLTIAYSAVYWLRIARLLVGL